MESLTNLTQAIGMSPVGLAIFAALFLAIFVGLMGASSLLRSGDSVQRRLHVGVKTAATGGAEPATERRSDRSAARWNNLLKLLETHVVPMKEEQRSSVRRRMLQAGYMEASTPTFYYAIRLFLALALPIIYLIGIYVTDAAVTSERAMITALALAAGGLYLPYMWVALKISDRQRAVRESFPDSLDMLVVCVEAGLGFDAAFNRVGDQMQRSHPVISWHFAMVALELRAGKSREDALRNFASRVGIVEVSSFVTLLIQSDAFGTSIAQTLRVQADEMRDKRMMRAEEKAHMLPVLLSIPLVTCILPAMLTVVLLPGIIGIVRQVIPALEGKR